MSRTLSEHDIQEFAIENAVKLIVGASVQLKCSVLTRTKALLIYHHFKRCVHEVQYDDYLVAAGCLSLSIKFNEEPVEFDAVIFTFFKIVNKPLTSIKDKGLKQMRKSLGTMECLILRMTEFSLNHHLAHEYLAYFINEFREVATARKMWDALVENSMTIASDFYLSNKCINYKADEIAFAVTYVSLYLIQFDTVENLFIRLKNLNKASDLSRADLIEEIYRVCDVGPSIEKQLLERMSSMKLCDY